MPPETNPYQFVPFPKEVPRRILSACEGHDRWNPQFLSGRFECSLVPEDGIPLLVANVATQPIEVAASGLKGAIRTIVEIAGQACGSGIRFHEQLPRSPSFSEQTQAPCESQPANQEALKSAERSGQVDWGSISLCRACILFGVTMKGASWRGKLRFSNGTIVNGGFESFTRESRNGLQLFSPRFEIASHYFQDSDGFEQIGGGFMNGRKLYQHLGRVQDLKEPIKPLWQSRPNTKINFVLHFENLTAEEAGLLAFALSLVPLHNGANGNRTLRHHFGYGRPAGYGSAMIKAQAFLKQARIPFTPPARETPVPVVQWKQEFFSKRNTQDEDFQAMLRWLTYPEQPNYDIRYPTAW